MKMSNTMAASLYNLSISATCRLIDSPPSRNVEDLRLDLPAIFQLWPKPFERDVCRRLKRIWMKETPLPMEPHLFDCRYLEFTGLPLPDKHTFIMLTNITGQDSILPHFWPIASTGHVYFDYYEVWLASGTSELPYVLCRNCFMKNHCAGPKQEDVGSPMSDFDYSTYWHTMGWKFFNVKSHFGCDPDEFIDTVVKRESSWCDSCVLQPLFRLYTWETCMENTDVHVYRRNNDDGSASGVESDDSSTASEESMKNFCTKTELYDPYHM